MEDTFRFVVLRARFHLNPRSLDQLGYQTRQMHLQLLQNFLQWHCCQCFEGDICEKACHACTEFRDNCPNEHHPTPPPAFTWRKLTPAKRVTRLGWPGNLPRWGTPIHMWTRSRNKERLYGEISNPTEAGYLTFPGSPHLHVNRPLDIRQHDKFLQEMETSRWDLNPRPSVI